MFFYSNFLFELCRRLVNHSKKNRKYLNRTFNAHIFFRHRPPSSTFPGLLEFPPPSPPFPPPSPPFPLPPKFAFEPPPATLAWDCDWFGATGSGCGFVAFKFGSFVAVGSFCKPASVTLMPFKFASVSFSSFWSSAVLSWLDSLSIFCLLISFAISHHINVIESLNESIELELHGKNKRDSMEFSVLNFFFFICYRKTSIEKCDFFLVRITGDTFEFISNVSICFC